MNLDKILKDVEDFEMAKALATDGEWFVLSQGGKPRCVGSKDYGVVPNSDCEWDASENDLKFIAAAKNFPTEVIIRELVDEVKRLEVQLAQKDEVIGRLKECLRFYGNGLKAKRGIEANDNSIHPAIYDGGHKARELLKELGE